MAVNSGQLIVKLNDGQDASLKDATDVAIEGSNSSVESDSVKHFFIGDSDDQRDAVLSPSRKDASPSEASVAAFPSPAFEYEVAELDDANIPTDAVDDVPKVSFRCDSDSEVECGMTSANADTNVEDVNQ